MVPSWYHQFLLRTSYLVLTLVLKGKRKSRWYQEGKVFTNVSILWNPLQEYIYPHG
jgi:hypothetical protein